jgi:alanyl-tRNA synthetase
MTDIALPQRSSNEIRDSFLDFFAERGHRIVPSSPLVPHGDATLLFTNAGMVQFKDYFLGVETPPSPRAVSVQKCLRVSGKHNDLENVGPSPRHHTFFEMLGNFSFGDYFKADAIEMAWELVTKVWGLPVEHLTATVFEEDEEAEGLWRSITTLPSERILRCGAADNFWAMGETGPCGPCSEIFVDIRPDLPKVSWEQGTDSGRYLEIWNLVFMQYERRADGSMLRLPNPSIDTGAGLERVTSVLQGVSSNYDTDLFRPLIDAAAALVGRRYGDDVEADTSLRVVADHLRAGGFLLADGVVPANDGRGYVLRRLLRRAIRHGMRIGFEEPFLHRLLPVLGEVMGKRLFPELEATREASLGTLLAEEERFLHTVAAGAKQVQEAIEGARRAGSTCLDGATVFRLYDTHGLPIDLIREIAEEERTRLDEGGFEAALETQRERSRAATAERQQRLQAARAAILAGGAPPPTSFDGYDELEGAGTLSRLVQIDDLGVAAPVEHLTAPAHGIVVLDRSVFYAESGGQVADTGTLTTAHGKARVMDVQKDPSGVFLHTIDVTEGKLIVGEVATLRVEAKRRAATEANHTATHLLHAALREVLGDGVRQAGSLVHPERLRFDFTFARPLTEAEQQRVEDLVNREIRKATPVATRWTSQKEALAAGAMALFGEKYGERVRTVAVAGFSLELCGGCHVPNTGAIGLFRLGSDKGVASGVRRLEATTAEVALAEVRAIESRVQAVAGELGVGGDRLVEEARALKSKVKDLEREIARLRREALDGTSGTVDEHEVGGFAVVVREVPDAPAQELRELADTLRDRLPKPGLAVLGARSEGKATILVSVHPDAVSKLHAGKLVKELAAIVGGGGGGRPDFAQAGGKSPELLGEALERAPKLVAAALGL